MKNSFLIMLAILLAACSAAQLSPAPTQAPPAITNSLLTPVASQPSLPSASPETARLANTTAPPPEPTNPLETSTIPPTASAPSVPVEFPDASQFTWRTIASGLDRPVGVWNAGDGSGRLFVIEQAGLIRIIQDGAVLPTPFLDIRDRVGSQGNEQGLLGLAFHPDYPDQGTFFVNYTDKLGDTQIARFKVSAADSNLADPASETRLLDIPQPYANHNGGEVAFGPDGYLYLGLGDGGAAGDPQNNAQSLESLLGKILRIDVNSGDPYTIPQDNQFAPAQNPEIWAYGLRNPWRFTFDRQTSDLYIGDVGQNEWEEIDFLPAGSPAGANFGWKLMEGNHPYQPANPPGALNLVSPIAEYSHHEGCSVTGGVVYRGSRLPEWNGVYLFADYCSGRVWGLIRQPDGSWQQQILFENAGNVVSFGEDENNEIYLVDLNGTISQLVRK
jgi:glucose/arabinose dehydrogenase